MIATLTARLRASPGPLRALLAADAMFVLALMVGAVATPWWVVGQGGARDLSLQGFAASFFAFLAAPLLGPLGDRHAKRQLITLGLAIYALTALLLGTLALRQRYDLAWVLLAALLGAVGSGLALSSLLTLSAELVEAAALPEALSLQRSAQALGRIIGPALGGALVAWSIGAAFWVQAGLMLAALLLARRLPSTAPPAPSAGSAGGAAAWWADLRAGLRACWAMPLERGWTLVNFVGVLFMLPAFTMLVPLKVRDLGLSGAWLGAAEAGLSLGMLMGALGGSAWMAARIGRHATRVGATLAQGLGLALAGLAPEGWLLVLALFFVGLANSCGVLVGQTHRMLAIPQAFRARVNAVGMMSMTVAGAAGPALAGLALLQLSVPAVYASFGLLAACSALGFLLVPDFRTLLNLDHESARDWYARRHPELFGPASGPGRGP